VDGLVSGMVLYFTSSRIFNYVAAFLSMSLAVYVLCLQHGPLPAVSYMPSHFSVWRNCLTLRLR